MEHFRAPERPRMPRRESNHAVTTGCSTIHTHVTHIHMEHTHAQAQLKSTSDRCMLGILHYTHSDTDTCRKTCLPKMKHIYAWPGGFPIIRWDLYIYAPHSVDALDVDPGHTCSAGDRMYGVLEGIPIMQSVEKVCRSSHEDK